MDRAVVLLAAAALLTPACKSEAPPPPSNGVNMSLMPPKTTTEARHAYFSAHPNPKPDTACAADSDCGVSESCCPGCEFIAATKASVTTKAAWCVDAAKAGALQCDRATCRKQGAVKGAKCVAGKCELEFAK